MKKRNGWVPKSNRSRVTTRSLARGFQRQLDLLKKEHARVISARDKLRNKSE